MKLQVSFDITDLDKALSIADKIRSHVDIIEIGALLLYKYGEHALHRFRKEFPQEELLVDTKIVDRAKDAVTLFAESGADWLTVMAGTSHTVIHTACTVAHAAGKKVMLDLADSSSVGQSALEAKSFGADALVFHKPSGSNEHMIFMEQWEMVKGNTQLPIFISAHISRENVAEILNLGASGVIIGSAIVNAADPAQEAAYFAQLIGRG